MRTPFFPLAATALIGVTMATGAANAESVMKVCGDQWQAAKAAGTTNGETWPQFLAQCRAQQKSGAATPAPTAAPAPAAPAPTYGQAPAEPPHSSLPKPMGNNEFASDPQARDHCPTDTVVWVNMSSHVYHFARTHNYGHTKVGAYMCEGEAKAGGDRAAENERHP